MKERRFHNRFAACAIGMLMLGVATHAHPSPVHIPDLNLRAAIVETLNIPHNTPITQGDMNRLTDLVVNRQGIQNLAGLEFATNLEVLFIDDNPITDLTSLSNLTNLTTLGMWGIATPDINPLRHLVNLTHLDAAGCDIVDISPLSRLTNLTSLNLRNNLIISIEPLANLTNLVTLRLDTNLITDLTPLANLTNLEFLEVIGNSISDFSPLDNLALSHLSVDQYCEMPSLPLQPRLANRTFPSIFAKWSGFGWTPIYTNRPNISDAQNIALHDLRFSVRVFGLRFIERNNEFTVGGDLDEAIRKRDQLLALNPNMIQLVDVGMRAAPLNFFPEDWPGWIRDENGNIFRKVEDDGTLDTAGLLDFTLPIVQDLIVNQAIAVAKCGLYDGIFFDYWNEHWPVLGGFRTLEAELQARENIVRRIRANTRPNFLIMGNTNYRTVPRNAPFLNGGFMETVVPHSRTGADLNQTLIRVENTLKWLETNLREPRINSLEGSAIPSEPPDSPDNLRWVRVITTLSLTNSDGYITFIVRHSSGGLWSDGVWYDFWDADLGRPVGEKGQLYHEIDGLYIREFTNGWAVYNHSGETQEITLPEEAISVATGLTNTLHTLPNIDGGIYLKKTLLVDASDDSANDIYVDTHNVNGNDIFIAEPIDAVPGAVLLLDASNNPSNNPGTTEGWVNLGTAGGKLLNSDRFPTVEEGEIEIPSIGFSGRRRYYTAAAARQTFGGPVPTNPKLYLGDWTLEFLCKRNGNLFALEHQFAGFQNSPREGLQGIRLWLPNDGQELGISIHADGFKQPDRALNIFLEENVWTWVTIVSVNGESIIAYQDGVEVSRHPGVHFDANLPLDDISIGSFSYDERLRNFNGSFSIVRVYDRALNPDEVLQNIGATVIRITNPVDVNGDGVVNILDLVAVAANLSQTGENDADVNRDGVVNILDLVQVAGAIGGGGAAPSAYSLDPSIISAADVERWLAGAQGLDVGDPNFQRGIRFLQPLLAALTPKETALLPNYPNPFNPETWIPYHLGREAEVAITIYDTKGTRVRRLALGNQAAGYYAERGKAAYWDGRNERGEAVASGIYFYQFKAGDFAASRRMVIVK